MVEFYVRLVVTSTVCLRNSTTLRYLKRQQVAALQSLRRNKEQQVRCHKLVYETFSRAMDLFSVLNRERAVGQADKSKEYGKDEGEKDHLSSGWWNQTAPYSVFSSTT